MTLNRWLTVAVFLGLLVDLFLVLPLHNPILLSPLVFVGLIPLAVIGWYVTPTPDKWLAALLGPVLCWIVAFVGFVIISFVAMYYGMRG